MNNALTLNLKNIYLFKINTKIFWVAGVLLIVALLFLYVYQITAEASERYKLQRYEQRLVELTNSTKNLEIASVEANSLDRVIGLLAELNFEKAERIHYIKILDNQVVVKQ